MSRNQEINFGKKTTKSISLSKPPNPLILPSRIRKSQLDSVSSRANQDRLYQEVAFKYAKDTTLRDKISNYFTTREEVGNLN